MQQSINEANAAARKLFGADTSILVARAPSFGNDDACLIVLGKRHAEAARHFALSIRGATLKTEVSNFMGKTTEKTLIEWSPR